MTERPKKEDQPAREIHRDAEGQFAPKQAGGQNDGVADAKPRVLNPSEDATIHNHPPHGGHSRRSFTEDDS